ncbi:hypothetical protein, partial [Enterobacter kobei]|uniref:hypothetical protein n=1 Tax=Enterobacter kobei TaxID=208224 RepID=UPI0021477F8B
MKVKEAEIKLATEKRGNLPKGEGSVAFSICPPSSTFLCVSRDSYTTDEITKTSPNTGPISHVITFKSQTSIHIEKFYFTIS